MAEMLKDGKLFGIETGTIIKAAVAAEGAALLYTGYKAMSLEAPKYCTAAGVATTTKASALKAGTTSTYHVLNTDAAKTRTKANLDAALAENQITNIVCKTQAAWFYPVVGMLFAVPDETHFPTAPQ